MGSYAPWRGTIGPFYRGRGGRAVGNLGAGAYVADLKLPGMLHVALVRSPYAHARIRGIDASAARSMPGVVTVVTGRDMLAACDPLPLASSGEGGEGGGEVYIGRVGHVLAVERARHTDESVAAVVAASYATALDAAQAIEVDYEPLPVVSEPLQALAPGAPLVFEGLPDNVDHRRRRQRGDVEAAFAAAHVVVRQRMCNQRLAGFPLEGRAVLAAPDPATGGLTLYSSTQTPHQVRGEVATVLRLSENQVRVIAPDVGGGFGVKIGSYPEEHLCAALALRLSAPVRRVETRLEHMLATTHGRAQICDLEAAADGTITALRMRIVADLGAYPLAPGLPDLTTAMGVGVYAIPNVDLEAISVYTNTTPVAAYRGAGRPEVAYYIERAVDLVAAELGLDPAEVRRRNFIPPEAFRYKTPTGLTYDSGEYDRALSKALERAGYAELRREQARRRADPDPATPLLGIGIACYVEMCGFGPYESAQVEVEPGGTVTVSTGISPHGQGTATTFAQIVADRLGVDFEAIVVRHGDTATTPMGIGTMGSRSLAVGGGALMRALDWVRDKAFRIAALMLNVDPEEIELCESCYRVRGAPQQAVSLAQITARAYSRKLPAEIDCGLEATEYFRPPDLNLPLRRPCRRRGS